LAVASGPRAAEVAAAMVRAWQAEGINADSFVVSRPAGGYEIA
jgi:hypothetical protein